MSVFWKGDDGREFEHLKNCHRAQSLDALFAAALLAEWLLGGSEAIGILGV